MPEIRDAFNLRDPPGAIQPLAGAVHSGQSAPSPSRSATRRAGRFCWPATSKGRLVGLEPDEIAAVFEQREAMLNGIREGVVAVDRAGQIS